MARKPARPTVDEPGVASSLKMWVRVSWLDWHHLRISDSCWGIERSCESPPESRR